MRKYIFWIGLALMTSLFSCSKVEDFGDTNEDPTAVNSEDAAGFLTYTLAYVSSTYTTPGIYTQYIMESQYPGTCFYSDNSSSFTSYYSSYLNYLQEIISMGYAGTTTNNMLQVSKILQQFIYWNVTNQWGDVPYSEALQGDANTTPAYDKQEDIYNGIISTIRGAVDSIDASTISGDIAFDGDADAWKRAGNSIIMLAAIQLSKRYPDAGGVAATAFNTALSDAGGYIATNDQNFEIVYPGDSYQNPWYTTYYSRSDYGESETLTDLMASLGDTRQHAFGGASTTVGDTTSSSLGLPYGVTRTEIVNWTSEHPNYARILRGDLRVETSPMVLISAAYVTLVRAEAANLGWTSESASSVYASGIQLSFEYWDEDMPEEYLTQEDVALGTDNVKKIAIQQYIAAYPNGLYAWNIWRKTGYPALTPSVNATNESGEIPRRYKYASSESSTNPDNLAIAIARLEGGNSDVARIWWDEE